MLSAKVAIRNSPPSRRNACLPVPHRRQPTDAECCSHAARYPLCCHQVAPSYVRIIS